MITIVYDDETTTFNARQEVLDRLQQATLPPGVNPALGPDYSPTGQIMFYTLPEHESEIRRDGTENAERLVCGQPVEVGARISWM